jgi:threonine 3-dehydrogenase
MLACRKIAPEAGLVLAEVPEPKSPGPGEVIVAVAAAGLCGTDMHVAEWHPSYRFMAPSLPVTIGHEFAGWIVARDPDADGPPLGAAVVVMPGVPCGTCAACTSQRPDDCGRRTSLGLTRDGGFAARVRVPITQCLPLPRGVPVDLGALVEPLSIGVTAVDAGDLSPGENVLILGPGTIGQSIALAALDRGATRVVVAGRDDASRLALCRSLGVHVTIDLAEPDAVSDERDFDVVFEATGSASAVTWGLARLRERGRMIVSGIHAAPVPIDLTAMGNGTNLRGVLRSDRDGAFWFRTARPCPYLIPDDGTVGQLLGALGRHPYRPAHIHFIFSAPGYEKLVTQIFIDNSPYLDSDVVFGVKADLIGHLTQVDDAKAAKHYGSANPFLTLDWKFVLSRVSP